MAGKPVKTIRLRRLATILREKRRAAGLSPAQAAARADVSQAWIYRAENAEVRPQANNVKAVLAAYGVTDPGEIAAIVTLARDAARPSWWESYGLTPDHAGLVALEADASDKSVWEPCLIPGLLQTPGYARAVVISGPDDLDPGRVEQLVRVRMERQKTLVREEPLRLTAVINEPVLHRPVGSPAVMREQLAHLREAAEAPNVTVRVLPSGVGAHPAMTGPFAILRYPDEGDADIMYCETPAGAAFLEGADEVRRAHRVFTRVAALSLTPGGTADLVAEYASRL